ncbi:MAG: hypothetical protein KKE50_06795 [Nanoarchaeota archaeon]|nr:hypothetical protein [Nanoarchaeota archaeon]
MQFFIRYRGHAMEYVYVNTDTRLSQEAREDLVVAAFDMYLDSKKSRSVGGDGYQGRITTDGRHFVLGAFGGQRFSASLDTDFGKMQLEFLVTSKTRKRSHSTN